MFKEIVDLAARVDGLQQLSFYDDARPVVYVFGRAVVGTS